MVYTLPRKKLQSILIKLVQTEKLWLRPKQRIFSRSVNFLILFTNWIHTECH